MVRTLLAIALLAIVAPALAQPIGEPPISATDIDVNALLTPAKETPPDNGKDPVGAFRFVCGAGQLAYDDPIVFPGQPGKSHLHQFYGNLGTNGNSTYAKQRTSGGSSCGNSLNRSGYWMPALLDGKGSVVEPDYVTIYYKRIPASDPHCADPRATPGATGICVPIPVDLKMIAGYDMVTGLPPTGHHHFACVAVSTPIAVSDTLAGIAAVGCPAGDRIEAMITFPDCWDGQRTDSANHRDHVSYATYAGGQAILHCDAGHPFLMPDFSLAAFYLIQPGDNLKLWHFSSDEMRPGVPAGTTYHADYWEGWTRSILMRWTENCIDRHLNCHAGQLGDGYRIVGADKPSYGWTNPHARVPLSSIPKP